MNKSIILISILLILVQVAATPVATAEVTDQDVVTIIGADQYQERDKVRQWVENNNQTDNEELYNRATEWLNSSERADQYEYIDGIREPDQQNYDTIIADVSDDIAVVDYYYENGDTVVVIDAERAKDISVVYADGNKLYRQIFSVDRGKTAVVIDGQRNEINVWDGNTGAIVSSGSDASLYSRFISDPDYTDLYTVAISASIYSIISIAIWVLRKRYNSRKYINEIIYEYDTHKIDNTDSVYERVINKIKKLWDIKYIILFVTGVIIAYNYLNITIPTWAYVVGATGVIVLPITYLLAPRLNKYIGIFSPSYDIYISTNPELEDQSYPFYAWRIHSDSSRHIDIEGERRTFEHGGNTIHICDYFDARNQKGYAGDYTAVSEELWYSIKEAARESRKRRNTLKQYAIGIRREINRIANEVSIAHHNNLIEKEAESQNYNGQDINAIVRDRVPKYEKIMNGEYLDDDVADMVADDDDNNNNNNKNNNNNNGDENE